MPKYERAPESVKELAQQLIQKYEGHFELNNAMVKIDFLFAYPDLDEDQEVIGPALQSSGYVVRGKCKIVSLKDRAKGNADAEILLDAEYFQSLGKESQAALLDHELHHIEVRMKDGNPIWDDLDRPKLKLRKHDVQVGWFTEMAQRHGEHSMERIQAKEIVEECGQLLFPEFMATTQTV